MVKRIAGNGFTLVELLVALTIALVLTVVALPRVREGLRQNAAARSAAVVKSVFESARANAIRTGRPYGVVLHRVKNQVTPGDSIDDPTLFAQHGSNYCNRISFAQMAFDYRGDVQGAALEFDTTTLPATPFFRAYSDNTGLIYATATGAIPVDQQSFAVGSVIRLGTNRTPGVITSLVAVPSATPRPYTRVVVGSAFPFLPGTDQFAKNGEEFEFTIETRPIASPLASIDLPGKVVVDLAASGLAYDPSMLSPYRINQSTDTGKTPPVLADGTSGYRDITVMFNSSGQLDGIYFDELLAGTVSTYAYVRHDPVGQLSFLIGETDAVVLPPTIATYTARNTFTTPAVSGFTYTERKPPNFANTEFTWLSINPSSGKLLLKGVSAPYGADEITVHPELGSAHGLGIIIRDRLLDSRRLTRGSTL